jgi:hypothetical protein
MQKIEIGPTNQKTVTGDIRGGVSANASPIGGFISKKSIRPQPGLSTEAEKSNDMMSLS